MFRLEFENTIFPNIRPDSRILKDSFILGCISYCPNGMSFLWGKFFIVIIVITNTINSCVSQKFKAVIYNKQPLGFKITSSITSKACVKVC